MHNTKHFLVFVAALLAGCSGQDDSKSTVPTAQAQPAPPVVEAAAVGASIASVQMLEDCPDPAPAPGASNSPSPSSAPASMPAKPASGAPMTPADSAPGFAPHCLQSTIQLSFEGTAEGPSQVVLKGIRLVTLEGGTLGGVQARLPTQWQDNQYQAWDEIVPAEMHLKTSYKITPPNWGEVERKLGKSSYNVMFVLEVDAEIGGAIVTLRSSSFARQQPVAIPT